MSESALRGWDRPGIAAHKSRCRTPPGRSHPRKADSDMGPPHLRLFPTPNCRADRTGVVPRPTKMCVVVNFGREVLGASATHAGIALCVRNSPRQTFLWVSRPRPFDPHGDFGLGSSLDGGRGGGSAAALSGTSPRAGVLCWRRRHPGIQQPADMHSDSAASEARTHPEAQAAMDRYIAPRASNGSARGRTVPGTWRNKPARPQQPQAPRVLPAAAAAGASAAAGGSQKCACGMWTSQ